MIHDSSNEYNNENTNGNNIDNDNDNNSNEANNTIQWVLCHDSLRRPESVYTLYLSLSIHMYK